MRVKPGFPRWIVRPRGLPRESASGGLIKIGAKVIGHAKYVTFQRAEVAMPCELFAAILDRVQQFGVQPPVVQRG